MSNMYETETTESVVPAHSEPVNKPKADNATNNKRVKAVNSAASKDSALAGSYQVITNLNMRHGAGMSEKVMTVIPKDTKVRNYGFYTEVNDVKWLYVQVVLNNVVYSGFCSSDYLNKI